MKKLLASLAVVLTIAGCSTPWYDPDRDPSTTTPQQEATTILTEATVALAVGRFVDGDKERAERVQVITEAVAGVLNTGFTVQQAVAEINNRVDWTRYDPATAELGRAAVALAAVYLQEYVGGVDVPLSEGAVQYARRLLEAAYRGAGQSVIG